MLVMNTSRPEKLRMIEIFEMNRHTAVGIIE